VGAKIKYKVFSAFAMFIFGVLFVTACFPPPELPVEPRISLKEVAFIEDKNFQNNFRDTLKVVIRFEDGNGDLGLRSTETQPPYHIFDYNVTPTGDTLNINSNDTMPPFNCTTYKIDSFTTANNVKQVDTNYITRNIRHFNYIIDVLIKEDDGEFVKFDYLNRNENCTSGPGPLGRFPYLNSSEKERPLEGDLEFKNTDIYRLLFQNDTIKLRVSIFDRAGNRSNFVESRPFYVDDQGIVPVDQ